MRKYCVFNSDPKLDIIRRVVREVLVRNYRTITAKEVAEKAATANIGALDELEKPYFAEPGTFEWALTQMKAGKEATRKAWRFAHYMALVDGKLVEFNQRTGAINRHDLLADDWQIYEGETE